jgi:hypothetical protein
MIEYIYEDTLAYIQLNYINKKKYSDKIKKTNYHNLFLRFC